jgi:hypothetical protein
MPLLRAAARAFLLNRLLRGGHRRRSSSYGRHPRRRGGSGFRMRGPFPTYSGRTRRGSRVTVGGCCLPIPLALTLAGTFGAGRRLRSR